MDPGARPSASVSFIHKYLAVLTGERRRLGLIAVLFIALSLFDTLTVSLIGPFVGALLNPAMLEKVPILHDSLTGLGFVGRNSQLLALGALLGVMSLTKGVFAFFVQWRLLGFAFSYRARMVQKLMRAYLAMPYAFFLNRNSSAFVQSITAHTKVLGDDLVIPSLRLTADGTMLLILTSFLLFVSAPAMLLLAAMLGLAIFGYVAFVRPIVKRSGAEVAVTHERIIRGVNEGIGGIKEIRVLRAEDSFFRSVAVSADTSAGAQQRFNALLVMPKYLMETVIVLFVILFSTYVILNGEQGEVLVATLAMFAAAGTRMLPAVASVSASVASMNYCRFVLDELYDDLVSIDAANAGAPIAPIQLLPATIDLTAQPADFATLELHDIRFAYPEADHPAVDGISLSLQRGESIALIGRSGSGKTTLVDILLGLHAAQSGAMQVNGQAISDYGWDHWVSQIAYIPQQVFMVDASIAENVAFGIPTALIDRDRVRRAIESAQLGALVSRMPDGLDTRLGERGIRLSGGERQRIGLARAFYMDRQVLILDEATSALDTETERQVVEVIRSIRGARTLIVIAHRLSTVRDCDRVYRLEAGRVTASGHFDEVVDEE